LILDHPFSKPRLLFHPSTPVSFNRYINTAFVPVLFA
jgi:hypothetical protein